MSLGTFCFVLVTLLIGSQAQNAANVAQTPKTYSLTPFLDPLGLTRPRPALFTLTSVPLGRLPLLGGFGAMPGFYPLGLGAYPNGQVPGANAGANTGAQTPDTNAGTNSGTQTPGPSAGTQTPRPNAEAQTPDTSAGTQVPGDNAEASN